MNRVARLKRSAFTIIELMLAMAFVSFLLLAVAMTVIQIANIYNRGLTIKEVNQAGSAISSELQRSVANSLPFNIDSSDSYIKEDFGGRLCTGQFSYIWNYGDSISSQSNPKDIKKGGKKPKDDIYIYDNNVDKTVRFVKVLDPGGSYCKNPKEDINYDDSVELLDVGEHNLAIHEFQIEAPKTAFDGATGQQLYSISFLIGTNDQLAIDSQYMNCKPPSESGADPTYCYINQFEIVARAGNSVE